MSELQEFRLRANVSLRLQIDKKINKLAQQMNQIFNIS